MLGKYHSEEAKRKISEALKGNKNMIGKHHSEETKKKLSETHKGKPSGMLGKHHSKETKKKLSESKIETQKGIKNHFFGKHHSEESKKKMSEAHKGNKNGIGNKSKTGQHPSSMMKGKYHSEETKRKISETLKGKKKNFPLSYPFREKKRIEIFCKVCGKKKYVIKSAIKNGRGKFCSKKCLGIWTIKHKKNKDTYIEIAIENELKSRNIPYLKQVPLKGIAIVDFLLSDRIIMQCDGSYWHSLPKVKARDINQDFILGFNNYKIFRFTEAEINKSVSKCIDKIQKEMLKGL